MNRPLVQVQGEESHIKMPAVFGAPIRNDIVQFVHTQLNKNNRQAYSNSIGAGEQTSAISWGTGRAVARIPRVKGSGTHRSGQAAFGNMCRGGRRFAPTKTWRRWHRRVSKNQKRYAVVAALAASAIPALVMARGHRVERLPEVPLVVSADKISSITKTKDAVKFLKSVGAYDDVERVIASRSIRVGRGKSRNRRYVQRRGPLIVYAGNNVNVRRAFRNILGVELACVERLNLLQLAPGGHLGRFIIWTSDAFEALDNIFGTYSKVGSQKTGFNLPRSVMSNADLNRIINSTEVQSVLRPKQAKQQRAIRKRNPLVNSAFLNKLNPYASVQKRATIVRSAAGKKSTAKKGKLRGIPFAKILLGSE